MNEIFKNIIFYMQHKYIYFPINNVLYPREDIVAKTTYIEFTFHRKRTAKKTSKIFKVS